MIRICRGDAKTGINFNRIDFAVPENRLNKRQAMRLKCLDCCAGDKRLAADCGIKTCALWPFQVGRKHAPQACETPLAGTPETENAPVVV
jgi:hypothetical protein